jgi:nucleotide-binding universal stress UspA family protein
MPIQILVPFHTYPDGDSTDLIRHAVAVARHLQGDVHALVLVADFPKLTSPLGTMLLDVPALVADTRRRCLARGTALLQALKTDAASAGIPVRTGEVDCDPASFGDVVAEKARYHDLTVAGLRGGDAILRASAESAIFASGRPVLLVPEGAAPSGFGHVLIAWDGSSVAARAVADARDFLQRATAVTIATVVDEKSLPKEAPGKALAAYLAGHAIKAQIADLRSAGRPIAQTLQDEARRAGAGLIVMGGFGHSRMRDFVLGGATRGILGDLSVPTLVSH